MSGRIVRSLGFPIDSLAPGLRWLLGEFRLIVNQSIRTALREDIRSRYRLSAVAYRALSADHHLYKQYIPSAFEVAIAVLRNYRRRLRQGKRTNVPYLRRLLLKAENQSYRLDRTTGRLRIPIRRGDQVDINLPFSEFWHRSILSDPSWGLGSLTMTPDRIIITVRKAAPEPYEPRAAIALDTNEISLDGVVAKGEDAILLTIPFPRSAS